MASAAIDLLLPSTARPPGAEAALRPAERSAAFGPVLDEAIHADEAAAAGSDGASQASDPPAAAEDKLKLDDEAAEQTPVEEAKLVSAEPETVDADGDGEEGEESAADDAPTEVLAEAAAATATLAVAAPVETAVNVVEAEAPDVVVVERQETSAEAPHGKPPALDAPVDRTTPARVEKTRSDAQQQPELLEFGDVLPRAPEIDGGPRADKRASAADRPVKGSKSSRAVGKSDPDVQTATTQAAKATSAESANVERAGAVPIDGDDGSADKKREHAPQPDATTEKVARLQPEDSSGQHPDRAVTAPRGRESHSPAVADSNAVAASAPLAVEQASEAPTPPGDASKISPVATGAAEPTAPTRPPAPLARLSAERSIHAVAAPSDEDGSGAAMDRARFVGRVEGAIRAAQQREGRVLVRLSPPELGALRIELTLHQGVLSARLETETATARNMLLDNLPALRDRLAQQDVRIDQFDVDVRRDAGGGSGQSGAHDRPARESEGRHGQGRQERTVHALAKPARATTTNNSVVSDASLDVRV